MALILTNPEPLDWAHEPEAPQLYNCLDALSTVRIEPRIVGQLAPDQAAIYAEQMRWQNMAMAMQIRGLRVDDGKRRAMLDQVRSEGTEMRAKVGRFVKDHSGEPIKYAKGMAPSPAQVIDFLFAHMEVYDLRSRKTRKSSSEKEVLERCARKWPATAPFVRLVLLLRGLQKQVEVLTTGISPDGRLRGNWSVGATETIRWSCTEDCYGDGTNLQNWQRRLRVICVPDPGMVFINGDLEQAESRCLAYLAQDEAYIAAHEAGNVHVSAAEVFWPDAIRAATPGWEKLWLKKTPVPWAAQMPASTDEADYSYYDAAKRRQHGFNFGLTPYGVAMREHCGQPEAKASYARYFAKYPRLKDYHDWVKAELKERKVLTTPLGFRRRFWGRHWDKHTIKEGIAFVPQSLTAHICKRGLWRIWAEHDINRHPIQLMAEGHDSGLMQVGTANVEWAKDIIREAMEIPVPINDRTMTIPVDIGVGDNWRDLS